MIEKTCQHCGKSFMTYAAWVRNGRGKHCSHKCADCGNRARDYHHPDYEQKLDVIPLCRSCHKLRHAKKETTCQTTRNPNS